MATPERMRTFREKRRKTGLAETTVWLSDDDRRAIDRVVKSNELRANQSEVIRTALRKAYPEEYENM
jgi:Arc/MetJ-type ribon-helix-helix transcriptional regulator